MSETFQGKLNYRTKKFDLEVFYEGGMVDVKDVVVDKEAFSLRCKEGCGVYNHCWACPPCSPSFTGIKDGFERMFVFVSYIHTSQINIKKPFLVLRNIYNILAPKMYKTGMELEAQLNGMLLKSGPCRVCRKCSFEEHKPCRSPEKRRYALESVGVDVSKLTALLGHRLLWFDGKKLPAYTSTVCGVLTNRPVLQEGAYDVFKRQFPAHP